MIIFTMISSSDNRLSAINKRDSEGSGQTYSISLVNEKMLSIKYAFNHLFISQHYLCSQGLGDGWLKKG